MKIQRLTESKANNDVFERYYEYTNPAIITDKEKLRRMFDAFLESPENGFFVVRWAGNDNVENNTSIDEFIANCRSLTEDTDDYNLSHSEQKYSSADTSINSSKLPAIFRRVQFKPNTVNLDYGGGKFDNASEFLAEQDVLNLIYDPFNRTAEHNNDVLNQLKKNGGADTATLSNVLNVIAEENVRLEVLSNIKQLLKPNGTLYITVYEGSKNKEGTATSKGYQLNRKTADYMDEIAEVFGEDNIQRKGSVIIARK